MLTFPNAKINLGLNITGKRPDGYHNLETVFYPVPVADALEVVPAEGSVSCTLHQSGIAIAGDPEQNLVVRAYRMLAEHHPLPPITIHLHKQIPSGAGLGGGSADAAFMLKLLNGQFCLGIDDDTLEVYAARLGADCAVFIKNRPVYAEGIGNLFTPIELSLKGYGILLVKPDIFVSTRDAFARITPRRPAQPLTEIIRQPVSAWRTLMVNDFEESVFPQFPAIGDIKQRLYDLGAVYASMSGSGSSVFGLFAPGTELPQEEWDEGTFVYKGMLE